MGNMLHCVAGRGDSGGWERRLKGLRGEINDLWIDPDSAGLKEPPKVLTVGTDQGMFWTADGGASVTRVGDNAPATQPRIASAGSISRLPGAFLVAGGGSLFYVVDRVPRSSSWPAAIIAFPKIPGFWTIAGAVLFLTFASSRLVSLTLQLNAPPFTWIAPWFYLSPLGRWRLYRRYRQSLRREMAPASAYYVDLPYAATGPAESGPVSEAVWKALRERSVTVVADGGRGKSTLARYVALKALEGPLPGSRRRPVPVIVEGLAYTGSLISALMGSLRHHGAYVNETIVASQLAAGYLLVVFDGYSEIREKYRDAAAEDLPDQVRRNPDARFIFTSRSELPPNLQDALGESLDIELQDLSDADLDPFLARYLRDSAHDAKTLHELLDERFPALPRIPLMLQLVAKVYAKEGEVPRDLPTLFSLYAKELLRKEATGIEDPEGLVIAICHLVRETYLRNPGSRGVSRTRAVEILGAITEQLKKDYGIDRAANYIRDVLITAGLYRQVGDDYLKFFHDTFESYFGARALADDLESGRLDLLRNVLAQEALVEVRQFLTSILAARGRLADLEARIGGTPPPA